jgi:hypothetical protein
MKKVLPAAATAVACMAFALAPAHAEISIIVSSHSTLAPAVPQVCQAFLGKIKSPTPINLSD